jgi:hypothetical protein
MEVFIPLWQREIKGDFKNYAEKISPLPSPKKVEKVGVKSLFLTLFYHFVKNPFDGETPPNSI